MEKALEGRKGRAEGEAGRGKDSRGALEKIKKKN